MNYKIFKLSDLFTLKAIKQAKSQSNIPIDLENGIPYIVQSTKNNMCKTYVNKQWLIENNEPPVDGNAIVLGVTTPAVSYQPYEFGASQVIVARSDFLNELTGVYFVSILEKQMYQFSYQRKPGMQLYKDLELYLPVDENDELNVKYIEEYMSKIKNKNLNNLKKFVEKYDDKEVSNKKLEKKIMFKNFKLSDIFNIVGTKSLDAGHLVFKDEGYNFVGRTSDNNGIQGKIDKQDFEPNEPYTITATVIGNYKYAKVQTEPYYCSQNINKLIPLDKSIPTKALYYLAAYVQIFISNWNGQQGGYKLDELKNHIISLPTIDGNTIDYEYMSDYITLKEKFIIKNTKKFINNN